MTQFRPTDEEYDAAVKEAQEIKKRNEAITEFENLQHSMRSCNPFFVLPPPSPPGNGNNNSGDDGNGDADYEPLDLADELIRKYNFLTINTSKEIYYFDSKKGVYLPNGMS